MRAGTTFLLNFGLAKAAIFLIPVAIAAVASPEVYGGVELAMSVGLLLVSFLFGGTLSGLTQQYIVKGERQVFDQLALLTLAGCALFLLAALVAAAAGLNPLHLLVLASIPAALIHNVASNLARTLGWRNRTAWADGTATLTAGLLVGLLLLAGAATPKALAFFYVAVAVAGTVGAAAALARFKSPVLLPRLVAATRIGLPMVVVGLFSVWLGVGGRILVGLFDPSQVAVYGLAFRIAGFALGIHQLAVTALFARLYKAKTVWADRTLSLFLLPVALLLGMIAAFGGYLPKLIGFAALRPEDEPVFAALLPVVAVQTFYWIAYAMLQIRINRSRLAGPSILPTFILTLVGIAVICGVGAFVSKDVVILSWLVAAHSAAYFFLSWLILARRKLPHRRIGFIGLGGGLALVLIALAQQV